MSSVPCSNPIFSLDAIMIPPADHRSHRMPMGIVEIDSPRESRGASFFLRRYFGLPWKSQLTPRIRSVLCSLKDPGNRPIASDHNQSRHLLTESSRVCTPSMRLLSTSRVLLVGGHQLPAGKEFLLSTRLATAAGLQPMAVFRPTQHSVANRPTVRLDAP